MLLQHIQSLGCVGLSQTKQPFKGDLRQKLQVSLRIKIHSAVFCVWPPSCKEHRERDCKSEEAVCMYSITITGRTVASTKKASPNTGGHSMSVDLKKLIKLSDKEWKKYLEVNKTFGK